MELERIRSGLGKNFEIIVNGKRSSLYKTCGKISSHQIYDLFSLPNALEDIQGVSLKEKLKVLNNINVFDDFYWLKQLYFQDKQMLLSSFFETIYFVFFFTFLTFILSIFIM